MILRFMGVNFTAINEGSALIPSRVGDEEKPIFAVADGEGDSGAGKPLPPAKTPEQDKAMWEGMSRFSSHLSTPVLSDAAAYYNAGSAALVLLLIGIAIGVFFYFRQRRQRNGYWLTSREESIPLSRNLGGDETPPRNGILDHDSKGKARELNEPVFDVGSDDEGDYRDHVGTK